MRGAYVFGPWTMSSDRPDFAYRSAPREDDRAEVWLHTPDDGSEPYWAGCFGGSDCFNLHGASTFEQARRALDQRIVLAGHYLGERVWADTDHWQTVATVAREIDAQHRPGATMHDDDLVDVIARALKDFPGLVRERDRLRAVLDAERGVKGLPGWVYQQGLGGFWELHQCNGHFNERVAQAGPRSYFAGHRPSQPCDGALDGMEKAMAALIEDGYDPASLSWCAEFKPGMFTKRHKHAPATYGYPRAHPHSESRMFIPLSAIQKIETRYIGRRVQRLVTVKSGITSVEAPMPDALQFGAVIGVAFNCDANAGTNIAGLITDSRPVPFRLIVEPDSGDTCEVWSTWTLTPDRRAPSSASLLDDVLEDTITVEAFATFVGIDKAGAEKLIEAEIERRKASAQD